jgi:dipeptidyl-peptidase-4
MKAATTAILVVGIIVSVSAQDRLRTMPGYEQHQRMQPLIATSWLSGAIAPRWNADSTSFNYALRGKQYRFDVSTLTAAETTTEAASRPDVAGRIVPQNGGQSEMAGRTAGCSNAPVARGRQEDCVISPDRKLKAFYRDRNVWLANADGSNEKAVTTDGSEKTRVKYGTGSWVYGEELGQTTAIWWSPDSAKVAFYRFDESHVKDYFLQMNQTELQDSLDVEAYPKAGTSNPIADVFVYDVKSGNTTKINARGNQAFGDNVVGHYVYNIRWLSDGRELLLNRANRRQQVLEVAVCSAANGACRAIVREEAATGWINTDSDPRMSPSPTPRLLSDGRRFIWESERSGWKNYYLYDIGAGKLITPLTSNTFEAGNIVKIDERAGLLFYTARDGDNYLKLQLHRVGLDGKGDVRLTDPSFTHSVGNCMTAEQPGCGISPDNRFIVDVYQRHDVAPSAQLLDSTGRVLGQISKSDLTRFDQLGLRRSELFSYKAADGQTLLFGQISFPSNFDPAKKYPVLVPVYGGPVLASSIPTESFTAPNSNCEYGFIVVTVSYRGVPGTGKRAADSLYGRLGRTEIDDMAEGVKALWSRAYVDKGRVGIYGTSYGGYTAAMQLLRHPDVFSAASASSPTSDWRNYDTIYTERYMSTPQENPEGYDAGSLLTYANNLKGRLLLYYGTADNNVHPSNSLQLIRALQLTNKSFEVQVGPDEPHSSVNEQRMMEFFIENLVVHPERLIVQ